MEAARVVVQDRGPREAAEASARADGAIAEARRAG